LFVTLFYLDLARSIETNGLRLLIGLFVAADGICKNQNKEGLNKLWLTFVVSFKIERKKN
jgi:hypothetical protein